MKQKQIVGILFLLVIGTGLAWRFLLAPNPARPTSIPEIPGSPGSPSLAAQAPEAGVEKANEKGSESSSKNGISPSNPGAEAPFSLSPVDAKKVAVLDEIILSKNDNDPRLDTELKDFSPAAKQAIQKKYADTAPEKRNVRGTEVFLLGREIQSEADVGFLKSVLMEKPCLSLSDCSKVPSGHSGDEDHLEALNETTANYPQIVALRALAHRAQELADAGQSQGALYRAITQSLKDAQQSPNPKVVDLVTDALREFAHD